MGIYLAVCLLQIPLLYVLYGLFVQLDRPSPMASEEHPVRERAKEKEVEPVSYLKPTQP